MNTRVSTSNNEFQKEKLECMELSQIELNIARLLAWGYTQKEIACIVHRSAWTISAHLKNIYHQLGIHKETDLTRWYLFKEYHIHDDPFKKVLAVFLLLLSTAMIFREAEMLRVFKSVPLRTAATVAKPVREKRYKNVFELQLITA